MSRENMNPPSETVNKVKRKRKKTFLSNARKYMKKGCYGRGSQIEEDTYHYLLKIMEAYKEGFPSDFEKGIFVKNAMQQTEDKEIDICCNQVGCRVIETLLPFATDDILRRYMTILGADLRRLCCDRFASHVICALLTITCTKSLIKSEEDTAFNIECKEFSFKVAKFVLNNLEDYIWDTYATHVIRSVVRNFAQLTKPDKNKKIIENSESLSIPDDYKEIVVDLAERLLAWPQFAEFPDSEYTSGLLQVIIPAIVKLEAVKLHKRFVVKLYKEHFKLNPEKSENDTESLPKAFRSVPAHILLNECVASISTNEKLFVKYYEGLYKGRLCRLATNGINTPVLKNLINCCQNKAVLESVFEELVDEFKKIIFEGNNLSLIATLGSSCNRLMCVQGKFQQAVMKAFDCFDPEERQNSVVLCLCRSTEYANLQEKNSDIETVKLNMQGALIVQSLLRFNKPIKVVNSILSMELNTLKGLFMNMNGCHIADAYMESSFVGEKSREKLIKKLQGMYHLLVTSRYGSRSFDAIWDAANLKSKESILQELSHQSGGWIHNEYGKHIARKVMIEQFIQNKDNWRVSVGKTEKKSDLKYEI